MRIVRRTSFDGTMHHTARRSVQPALPKNLQFGPLRLAFLPSWPAQSMSRTNMQRFCANDMRDTKTLARPLTRQRLPGEPQRIETGANAILLLNSQPVAEIGKRLSFKPASEFFRQMRHRRA